MAEDIHTVLYSFLHIQKVSVYEVNNEVFDVVARTLDNSAGLGDAIFQTKSFGNIGFSLNFF